MLVDSEKCFYKYYGALHLWMLWCGAAFKLELVSGGFKILKSVFQNKLKNGFLVVRVRDRSGNADAVP
jgi:hypothetical protein